MVDLTIDKAVLEFSVNGRKNRAKPVIMVVEDDDMSRHMLVRAVREYGEIVEAENGAKAIQKYTLTAPDIIFLDIELPDTTGHEILDKIIEADSEAFIVMLTSHTEASYVQKAVRGGARGYLAKPFKRNRVEHYIKTCIARKRR